MIFFFMLLLLPSFSWYIKDMSRIYQYTLLHKFVAFCPFMLEELLMHSVTQTALYAH